MDQQRNAHQSGAGEGDQPKHHCHGCRRLLLDPKNRRQGDEAGDLRAAAHTRKLQRGSYQRHGQQQHGARKIHFRVQESSTERLCDATGKSAASTQCAAV